MRYGDFVALIEAFGETPEKALTKVLIAQNLWL